LLKNIVKKTLAKAGYTVLSSRGRYMQDGLVTVHNDDFRRRGAFQEAYRRGVAASNGVDPEFEWRVHVALWAAATSLHVPGDFVECGVNAGFISSAIMQRLRWNTLGRRYYLVDTFSGPVLDQYSREEVERGRLSIAEDALRRGAYVTDLERVRANYAEWPNAIVVQGAVPEVLSTLPLGPIAFLHIDMNCAYPERAALEFLWPTLSPGGLVLLDDYAYLGHNEQAGAMDEAARGLEAEILSIPTGQGLIIKK
jgi:hypothetical protein